MNKDIIYIDVEDDITAIIERVKNSSEKIVALVPPKRVGVLQSVVNLRLLSRVAEKNDKHLVIVTGNPALTSLAGAAKIPVAKNLQSKPEIAEIPALSVDDNDVIDGIDLPESEDYEKPSEDSSKDISSSPKKTKKLAVAAPAVIPGKKIEKPKATKKGDKIPDFNKFRKKLFIGLGVLVLLIGFFVWANWIAPSARIIITAKTSPAVVDKIATLTNGDTSFADNTLKSEVISESAEASVDFNATGKKDVGEKATGRVTISTGSIDDLGKTIEAGTELSSQSGAVYVLDSSVTISISNYRGATSSVTAKNSGSNYNAATGSLSGAPGSINVRINGATSGGTDKTATVVTQADIDGASSRVSLPSDQEMKTKLQQKVGEGYVVIDQSYSAGQQEVSSSVQADQEVQSGKVTVKKTYSIQAVKTEEIKKYLESGMKTEIAGKENQHVYNNGLSDVKFSQFNTSGNSATVKVTANGQIGPKIDEAEVKKESYGKKYGEVQSSLEAIEGINDVDIKFYPFWVNSVPSNDDKITIEFKLDNNG